MKARSGHRRPRARRFVPEPDGLAAGLFLMTAPLPVIAGLVYSGADSVVPITYPEVHYGADSDDLAREPAERGMRTAWPPVPD